MPFEKRCVAKHCHSSSVPFEVLDRNGGAFLLVCCCFLLGGGGGGSVGGWGWVTGYDIERVQAAPVSLSRMLLVIISSSSPF